MAFRDIDTAVDESVKIQLGLKTRFTKWTMIKVKW
jgi:hypothetical protein